MRIQKTINSRTATTRTVSDSEAYFRWIYQTVEQEEERYRQWIAEDYDLWMRQYLAKHFPVDKAG